MWDKIDFFTTNFIEIKLFWWKLSEGFQVIVSQHDDENIIIIFHKIFHACYTPETAAKKAFYSLAKPIGSIRNINSKYKPEFYSRSHYFLFSPYISLDLTLLNEKKYLRNSVDHIQSHFDGTMSVIRPSFRQAADAVITVAQQLNPETVMFRRQPVEPKT